MNSKLLKSLVAAALVFAAGAALAWTDNLVWPYPVGDGTLYFVNEVETVGPSTLSNVTESVRLAKGSDVIYAALPPRGCEFKYADGRSSKDVGKVLSTFTGDPFTITWKDEYAVGNTLYLTPHYVWLKYDLRYCEHFKGSMTSTFDANYIYTNEVELAAAPAAPAGWQFAGWSLTTNGAAAFAPGDVVSGDDLDATKAGVTLYGVWEKRQLVIRLDADGGEVTPASVTVEIEGRYELPTPTKADAVFGGWFTERGGKGDQIATGDEVTRDDVETLYANWIDFVTLTFQYRTGSAGVMTNDVRKFAPGASVVVPEGFDGWVGHYCYGWSPSLPATATEDATFVAQYEPNRFTVVFDGNGASGSTAAQAFVYDEAKALTKNGFRGAGLTFLGWGMKKDDAQPTYGDQEVVSNLTSENGAEVTLYALWSRDPYWYAFEPNGGEGERRVYPAWREESFNLESNEFTRLGYAFAGWAREATAKTAEFADGAEVVNLAEKGETNALYAVWSPNDYVVNFVANGGSGAMAPMTCTYDEPTNLTANAFARGLPGAYSFAGWAATPTGEVEWADRAAILNLLTEGETNLYAVWTSNLGELSVAADTELMLFSDNGGDSKTGQWTVDTGAGKVGACSVVAGGSYRWGSTMTASVSGPGTLKFFWRANTGTDSDKLNFSYKCEHAIERVTWSELPPRDGWGEVAVVIDEAGTTDFQWFVKTFDEEGKCWVDGVAWIPAGREPTEEDRPVIDGAPGRSGNVWGISLAASRVEFDYELLGTNRLVRGEWPVLMTLRGTGGPLKFEDSKHANEVRMFYRARVVPRQ